LKRQNAEIARLSEQLRAVEARQREAPKRKFISASIQQPEYLAYLARWSKQIERAGEQHFQNEARRLGLSGSVIVSVSIARDGQLLESQIVNSSGSVLLDDLAVSISKLASPFEPIPELDGIDILSITRTWTFE
jgi:periplasmic protein TonB